MVQIRVLGPVELGCGIGELPLNAEKQRRLLAALVARAGEACSIDALVDAVWGACPPASADKLLQVYVSQLRKLLHPAAIRRRGATYALELNGSSIDADQFERLLAEAKVALKAGNPALAVSALRRALGLWRGPAYGEFGYEDFARGEAERLEELRLAGFEARFDAELALGRHADVVPELSALAADHPLRERLQAQAMLALYRSGRQSQALEIYRALNSRLRDGLGLEPSIEVRDLHRRILQHDLELATPQAAEAAYTLPEPPNALLGRQREIDELRQLLLHDEVRLLVLTGAGGSGKTRLALEAARTVAPSFANGAAFVELAPVKDPALWPAAVARALALKEVPGRQPLDSLAGALRPRELLLVLDNAEHLHTAAADFADLLARTPRLTLLVTSRVVLHLSGEHVYPVQPLAEEPAFALFQQRAREADDGFRPDTAHEQVIRGICARLDGLPLVIELAAARTRILSPPDLLERLDGRLPLLTGGPRDLPARQRTLRATIEWSFDLLDGIEQRLFARLAVFRGGCTLEAAETICDADLDTLQSLLDNSLLCRTGDRYWMLETIREYAADQLEQSGSVQETERRHAEYFRAYAERVANVDLRWSPGDWPEQVEREHDNLRRALDWSDSQGDAETSLRIASALWRFWQLRGHRTEGRRRLEAALSADSRPSAARAHALNGLAAMYIEQGEGEAGRRIAEEALQLNGELGQSWEAAFSRYALGQAAYESADFRAASALFQQSADEFSEAGDEDYALLASRWLAGTYEELGELARARAMSESHLLWARAIGNHENEGEVLTWLARTALDEERLDRALPFLRDGAHLFREHPFLLETGIHLRLIARALALTGNAEDSVRLLSASEAIREELDFRRWWFGDITDEEAQPLLDQLGDHTFKRVWAEGRALSADEALALAIDALED